MRRATVRVEAKKLPHNASFEDRQRNFENLLRVFNRQVQDAGIMHLYKKYEFYEKPSDVERRKRRQRKLNAMQGSSVKRKEKRDFLDKFNF